MIFLTTIYQYIIMKLNKKSIKMVWPDRLTATVTKHNLIL